jgi:hypothetical protein
MNLTASQLRAIVTSFLKEQFEVDKFRISSAVPSEFPKGQNPLWTLWVHYDTPLSPPKEVGNLKIPLSASHSILILIDDEEKRVVTWSES